MKKILLIDANSIIHRAYHALPPLQSNDGKLTNAIYGFFLALFGAKRKIKPDIIIAAFDSKEKTFRHKEYKDYKSTRIKASNDLYWQIGKTEEILRGVGFFVLKESGYEADDLIGSAAEFFSRDNQVYVLSGDSDLFQLVSENVFVVFPEKGVKEPTIYTPKKVFEKMGVLPSQIADYKGLAGDSSDNIPGIPGIGKKTAVYLLGKYGSVEEIYEAQKKGELPEKENILKKLKDGKEAAVFSKKLATIKKDINIGKQIKLVAGQKINEDKLLIAFKKLGFHSLIIGGDGKKESRNKKTAKEAEKPIIREIEKLCQEKIFSETICLAEKKLVPIIREMEKNGIMAEKEKLLALSDMISKKIKKIKEKIYEFSGEEFNLNSPKQISAMLFGKLNISAEKIKKTAGGAISTSASELEKIKNSHPIIPLISEYRELFKLKSGFIDALPAFIGPDNRIHPKFHQLGAATGRISCSDPNLQNIPAKKGVALEIRKCFVAPPEKTLLSFDYSQMELRVAAFLAREKEMMDSFKQRKDIHKMTAAKIFQLNENEVSQEQRKIAKTLNFGILYGMGAHSFSQTAGISFSQAKEFIASYFEKFPALSIFRNEIIKNAKKNNFVETFFGRKRLIFEINSTDKKMAAQAERIAVNAVIQGTASDIIKMAMVRLKEKGLIGNKVKLILQIHDELLFEAEKNFPKEKILAIRREMENTPNFPLVIPVNVMVGKNWGELENVLI